VPRYGQGFADAEDALVSVEAEIVRIGRHVACASLRGGWCLSLRSLVLVPQCSLNLVPAQVV
jgi:hypothetical protein